MADRKDFIGADALGEALNGHLDLLSLHGPRPFNRIVSSLWVVTEEFTAASAVVVENRRPSDEDLGPFTAGFVDGFVVGVRAARAAAKQGGGK